MARFFISHVTTEAPVASLIAGWLGSAEARAFVASNDISPGQLWLQALRENLAEADVVLVLASRRTIDRRWVWFEAGSAWADANRRCIPLCFEEGFGKDELPEPLASLQAIDIATDAGMISLFDLAGLPCSLGEARARRRELESAVAESALINPRTERRLPAPACTGAGGVLIDASHRQDEWPRRYQLPNLLTQTDDLKTSIDLNGAIALEWIDHAEQIWRHDLCTWPGLVLALPYQTQIGRTAIDEIKAWVDAGGRLLLLGFELGDRHHHSNLNQLADLFGIRFNTDVVSPAATFMGKPYDSPLDIMLRSPAHPLLAGLASIRLWNSQSVSTEPGGTPVITLEGFGISRLRDDTARYDRAGWQTGGNQQFVPGAAPSDRYLAAFAPSDLCGRGQVLALGTWDLRISRAQDTRALVHRLLTWLATGEPASV